MNVTSDWSIGLILLFIGKGELPEYAREGGKGGQIGSHPKSETPHGHQPSLPLFASTASINHYYLHI